MDDGRDSFLSRYLKNWAVQQQPPAGARERLLKTAAGWSLPDREQPFAFIMRIFSPNGEYRYPQDDFKVPMTQSQLWSFHFAMDFRLVT
jgi:hypothetical protein